MMDISEIIINIDAYRSQQQGHYGHRLQLFTSRKVRKEEKLHRGKSSLNKGQVTR